MEIDPTTSVQKSWIEKMIEREAIPKQLRPETVAVFCQENDIVESNYYYHSSKPEIKAKIIEIALDNCKKHAPEVLENLGERAKNNSKDAEMYLKFILQLAERTDLTSKNERIFNSVKDLKNEQLENIAAGGIARVSQEGTGEEKTA